LQAANNLRLFFARNGAFLQAELLKLHGMGPKALELIRHSLAASGKSFAD
jgi:hypothetical protein